MNEREAQAYRRLQYENTELRKQLEKFQSEEKAVAREWPPPSYQQFEKMGYWQRVEFKEKYPEIYAEYVK